MKKRLLSLICTVLMFLPAIHAGAELNYLQTDNKQGDIVVIYIPAAKKGSPEIQAALYTAEAIKACNPDKNVEFWRADSNTKADSPSKAITPGSDKGTSVKYLKNHKKDLGLASRLKPGRGRGVGRWNRAGPLRISCR